MSLFHHIKKLKLVYLDKEFYQQNKLSSSPFEYGPLAKEKFTENLGFRKFLFWKRKELDLKYLIKQGKLKGDWLTFKAWYNHNKGHLLFRGLKGYSGSSLRNLIKYGNDRHASDPRKVWDRVVYREHGLRPQDFIWAYDNLNDAWQESSSRLQRFSDTIVVIYDSRLLEKSPYPGVYTLKEDVNSFKDALLAVVLINLGFLKQIIIE
ncbi:hypothetical protein CMO94_01180 [Candidatus Woesearchaeota archaeon]|jgi:hypothetical protein|nr:hypothetical protein [Candidatus Woesearchaeota archaeon]|tara:strand:+ start:879 stop:1499 length:621 start_codon:yes stop_codon:yes gene_type:complete